MRWMALAGVAVLAAATAGIARAGAGTTLIVTGHGWGHGVGMSQWGAYGYARHGWDYKRILSHYYPGTKLVTKPGEPQVRVLLEQGARDVTVGCAALITVSNGHRSWHLAAKRYGISPRLAIPVDHIRGARPFVRGYALFTCVRAPLTLDGRPYRGTLALRSNGTTLDVVNMLNLDAYVRGVVPSESPSRWPLAELEAQAVAARSYALAELKPPSARYDLLPDARSQVYGGMAAQRPRSDDAVDKTKGQILTFGGEVARTYYSSSSGGRTESAQDAFGSAIPYLRSVADPYDTYSPNHDWGPFPYSGSRLGAVLGVGGTVKSVVVKRNSSDRVADVVLRLASGKSVVVGGEAVTRALGLKSTWFDVGELSVTTSSADVLYGRSVRVVAQAVDAKGAVLQQQRSNGAWRTLSHIHGRATVSVEPLATTAFRLRIPGVSGDAVDVGVRPQLRVHAAGPRLLSGEVLPRRAGPVEVWRLERGAWKVVSRPKLLQNGTFRTPLRLRAATYRVTAGTGAFAPAMKRLVITRQMLDSMSR